MQEDAEAYGSNLPEFTVGEISQQVKRTIESRFDRVRVRGEISQPKRAASGHIYLPLKDESAVLDGICWRGAASRLSVQPEEGMEVICTGKLTTFPGRSKYQMVIEQMELAGEGALLKLLEERRRRLAAEGLFDEARKRPLPFLPEVIGVVTSPTGAVIRDILHRLADRFPVHVLVWPVLVQGEGAKDQVARAIEGFNAIEPGGPLPRPDLLIVARGGGSLEDLWAFNEEIVVRAAAASRIPLIAAVGHETDTTLIDHAADRRAPTPTAAAEMAVPVRADLISRVMDSTARASNAVRRRVGEADTHVRGLVRGIGDPRALIESKAQTVDYRWDAASAAAERQLARLGDRLRRIGDRLPTPHEQLAVKASAFEVAARGLDAAMRAALRDAASRTERAGARLRPEPLSVRVERGTADLGHLSRRLDPAAGRIVDGLAARLVGLERLLDSNSYQRTLDRGFVLVRDEDGRPVPSAEAARPGSAVRLQFHDGERAALIASHGEPRPRRRTRADAPAQGDLL